MIDLERRNDARYFPLFRRTRTYLCNENVGQKPSFSLYDLWLYSLRLPRTSAFTIPLLKAKIWLILLDNLETIQNRMYISIIH